MTHAKLPLQYRPSRVARSYGQGRGEFEGYLIDNAIKTAKLSQNRRFRGDKQVITSDKVLISAHEPAHVSAMGSLPEGALR